MKARLFGNAVEKDWRESWTRLCFMFAIKARRYEDACKEKNQHTLAQTSLKGPLDAC